VADVFMSLAIPQAMVAEAPDEAALARRARDGDREAFDALMRAHLPAIRALALRWVGDPDEAADLCQQAFVRAFRSMPRFRGDASFRTWLYRIAIRLAADAARARGRTERLEGQGDRLEAPRRESELPQDLARLRAAIARLPARQRAVVELRTFEAMSVREVARVLGTTALAVRVNYHYALGRLRKEMVR
jgi:RNA polymerase sigma-70 factor (ECF subfamily)